MDPIMCTCGATLVEGVTDSGVKLVGSGEPIVFQRRTDYVLCASCLASYDVRSLIERAKELEVIEHLEKMAEGLAPGGQ